MFVSLLYILVCLLRLLLPPMATAPVKSKNLHNFSLPFLKWAHKNSTHRHRRLSDSPSNPSPQPDDPNHPLAPTQNEQSASQEACDEAEESSAKPWNLRPRKSVLAQTAANETGEPPYAAALEANQGDCVLKSQRIRGNLEGGVQKNERRDKKPKLWISLSREEIEEDVYSMNGSRPARRPKKRTKTLQKQLDNVFPGLYLDGATADSFRVRDSQ